jgi:truncated hemoglobin YjbI
MTFFSTNNTVVHLLEESRDPKTKKFDRVCLLLEALVYAVMGEQSQPDDRPSREDYEDAGYHPVGVVMPTDTWPAFEEDEVLVRAPVVRDLEKDVVLEEWLRQRRGENVWVDVVKDFYSQAAMDPEVAGYFWRTDMAQLQRHFVAALRIVTGKGLTRGTLRAMGTAHVTVSNADGQGITGPVFDKVINTLAGVLGNYGVPADTIGQILPMAAQLKTVIVTVVDLPR